MADALHTSIPEKPTALTTASPPTPFRFSLLTLLSITTLAGFMSAIVFSKDWDSLERLLMAFWCAGLIVGVSFGRARGKSGIFSAGFGAAIGCMLATLFLRTANYQPEDHAVILVFVMVAGWLIAVSVAAFYHALLTGSIEAYWRHRILRRTIFVLGGLAIMWLLVWQPVRQRAVWKPAWEQSVDLSPNPGLVPEMVLSPPGDRLILTYPSPIPEDELSSPIYELTPSRRKVAPFSLPWGWAAVFAPNGQSIALLQGRGLQLFDARSGTLVWNRTLDLNSLEVPLHHRFSADGRRLYVTTHTPRIQRLHVIDVDGGLGGGRELFQFTGKLFVSDGGDKLIKFIAGENELDEHTVEIVDLVTDKTICRLPDVARVEKPIFSPAGDQVALGSRIWILPGGIERPTGGKVIGLLSKGRVLVVDHNSPRYWRDRIPAWMHPMPFVHHLLVREGLSQLRITNDAGQTILASPWQDVGQVELSANQRIAVSRAPWGRARIWKVPE